MGISHLIQIVVSSVKRLYNAQSKDAGAMSHTGVVAGDAF